MRGLERVEGEREGAGGRKKKEVRDVRKQTNLKMNNTPGGMRDSPHVIVLSAVPQSPHVHQDHDRLHPNTEETIGTHTHTHTLRDVVQRWLGSTSVGVEPLTLGCTQSKVPALITTGTRGLN